MIQDFLKNKFVIIDRDNTILLKHQSKSLSLKFNVFLDAELWLNGCVYCMKFLYICVYSINVYLLTEKKVKQLGMNPASPILCYSHCVCEHLDACSSYSGK